MPKGKPKKDNPALYGGSPEPSEPSTTRYAAVHRRGGTHKVRDEHKTDSKYDNYNYKELVDQAKERGIYRKDMKKVEMAWALKHDDEEERRAEQDAVLALQRKRQEAKEEEERRAAHKQRQIEEKQERRIEKERRRQRDESVSDDTLSDADIEAQETSRNEYAREQFGQALSDESWNSTSTESSPEPPMDRDTKPDCRLRLFEWPHEQLPDTHPPRFFCFSEPKPRAIPYAPLRLTTTSSKQKLVLPGSKYPTGVDPDFCPLLSPRTRSAARNGHLIGTLRHAIVESGVDWAQRTLVQGWNAHMYFRLGSRHHNESKRLADTYRKWWLENRKVLRVTGKGEARKEERAARHVQRRRNRTRLVQEVYESSLGRPGGMGYVAAYLDYYGGDGGGGGGGGKGRRGTGRFGGGRRAWEKEERVLENLFFVRFLGCDVPHYYFWTREGEWEDPCFPNPAWEAAGQLNEDEQDAVKMGEDAMGEDAKGGKRRYRLGSKNRVEPVSSIKTRLIRVRRPSLTLAFTAAPSPSSPSSPFSIASAITRAEYHLYTYGLSSTLSTYRARWLAKGKATHWKTFAANLPTLWPSGNIPDVPPLESRPGACLALKIAAIDASSAGGKTTFSPLMGEEAWTGNDDKLWEVVEVMECGEDREDDDETGDESDRFGGEDVDAEEADGELEEIGNGNDDEALYRRGSMVFTHDNMYTDPVMAWLDKISPTFAPSTTLMSAPKAPVTEMGLKNWEERYLKNHANAEDDVSPLL
ncbi:hypothetical protein AA0121_g11805 [Alternaria tenuissima]|nr:hypothetical protein AA0121_g11805 [Alternaria tenuissima]